LNSRKEAQNAQEGEGIMREVMGLCDVVRKTAFSIHCYHKSGHLEKVYENALVHRL
jgi:hypothetical protein